MIAGCLYDAVCFMRLKVYRRLDTRLAIPSFREKCEELLYDYGMQPEIKWKTAIKTMEECPNDAVKTYLRRVSKNIIAMYM